ncbi:MAG: hypothetical protein M3Z84_08995 [Actinomycetota bacterium]|nr:hypothetical protein [Actinomycetota bacterium]
MESTKPFLSRFLPWWLLAAFALAAMPALAADADGGEPVSIVIAYKARPETRAAFRALMETDGAARFARWQKEGLFRRMHLLFTPYAGSSPFDMIVILDFARYTDLGRWKEIEQRMPGGLTPEALALAGPESSWLAELFVHGESPEHDPAKAADLLSFYEVVTDAARYRKYVEGYTVPQLKGWIEAGVLGAYSMYVNQGVGTSWNALLVLEYKDMAALAQREAVKAGVRQRLAASDPVWKAWSNDKGTIRNERSLVAADPVSSSPNRD